jgi:hypothetical protein
VCSSDLEYGARAARIVREALAQNAHVRLGAQIYRYVYEPDAVRRKRKFGGADGRWVLRRVPFETSPRTDETSVRRDGMLVSGRVIYAERGLSIITEVIGEAVNYGFNWEGPGRIEEVTVDNRADGSWWQVRLSEPAAGRLSYATTMQPSPRPNAPCIWGNLFDNCAEPSIAIRGLALRQGLLPFSVEVA